jgi:serine/threonine-protein kinase
MAKVFTITEGLENLGALKTGGQGSVYKGRRTGEIITAIKILPTPIYSETPADKNFASFQNEVNKLKKVNEHPNPNVVSILHSGITESGNFPFTEMEYIEGPDLGELLTPPNDAIFSTSDVLKVADHLSNAIAHCHSVDIRHGDIKSNNVKFNVKTGNYVLLDFGLSVMSDEQRRTSFRHAGAIEFMAPEQNEGLMLLQTDVYSFGVILYELLAGVVPFALKDKSESARNVVMLSHMEYPPPDLLQLRQKNLPAHWSTEKKAQEMQVPEWLVTMIYLCLQKKPEYRFANGMELKKYIQRNLIAQENLPGSSDEKLKSLEQENEKLKKVNKDLEQRLAQLQVNQPGNNGKDRVSQQATAAPMVHPAQREKFGFVNIIAIVLPLLALASFIYIYIKYSNPSKNEATPTETKTESSPITPPTIITSHKSEEVDTQLQYAEAYLRNKEIEPALLIYKNLVKKEVPEAMFQYGNLALQNLNKNIGCDEGMSFMVKAADAGYMPAKTTLGFLYSFAGDDDMLRQNGYDRCGIVRDITRGSKLLMEAMLGGDSTASLLLDELNANTADSTVQ